MFVMETLHTLLSVHIAADFLHFPMPGIKPRASFTQAR